MVKHLLSFCVLTALLLSSMSYADVRSFVNRESLYDDESLILTVVVSPSGSLRDQDLAALESLFVIEQRTQQQLTQIINGQRTSQVEYRFRLTPRQTGAIGIPNFRVANDQSQPIFITVLDSTNREDSLADDDILLTVEASTTQPYVNQPFTLTVELAYKVQLTGDIASLNLTNFDTTLLFTNQSQEIRNGIPYNIYRQVIELTSETSGDYDIPDIRFSGEYPNRQAGRYERVTRTATVSPITVRPIPADYPAGAYWLPLNNLTLTENISSELEIDANQYIDWQVALTADGLSARQLPDPIADIEDTLDPNIKIYREAPTFNEQQRIDTQSFAINKAGTYTIPAIKIPWWNVELDQLMWLETEQKSISVLANETPLQPDTSSDNSVNTPPNITEQNETDRDNRTSDLLSIWLWLLLATLLTMSLMFVFILARSKKRLANNNKNNQAARKPTGPTLDLAALAAGDNVGLFYHQFLLTVERLGLTLTFVKGQLNQTEASTLQLLEAHLFAGQSAKPSKADLRALTESLLTINKSKADKTGSAFTLYPT